MINDLMNPYTLEGLGLVFLIGMVAGTILSRFKFVDEWVYNFMYGVH